MRNSLYNVDGVLESQQRNGGLVVEGYKQTTFSNSIFFKKHGGYIYMCIFARKSYDV